MRFSLIVTAYNQAHLLERFVDAVKRQSICPNEFIIADDHSIDNTPEVVEKIRRENKKLNIRYIRNKRNIGYVKTLNSAITKLKYSVFIHLQLDTVPANKACFKNLIKNLSGDTAIAGAVQIIPPEVSIVNKLCSLYDGAPAKFDKKHIYEANQYMFGAYRKEVFESFGYFKPEYGIALDTEWSIRMKSKGFKILMVPSAVIYRYAGGLKVAIKKEFNYGRSYVKLLKFSRLVFIIRILPWTVFLFGLFSVLIPLLRPFLIIGLIGLFAFSLYMSIKVWNNFKNLPVSILAFLLQPIKDLNYSLGFYHGLVELVR